MVESDALGIIVILRLRISSFYRIFLPFEASEKRFVIPEAFAAVIGIDADYAIVQINMLDGVRGKPDGLPLIQWSKSNRK